MPSKIMIFTHEEIKNSVALDSSIYEEDINASAKWVQDEFIEKVLGTPLFNAIIEMVRMNKLKSNIAYYNLCHDYLLYIVGWGVRAEIQPLLHNKVRNAGTVQSTDENIKAVEQNVMYQSIRRFEERRNSYMSKATKYLNAHASDFVEYAPCCSEDGSQKSANTICGIYLDE